MINKLNAILILTSLLFHSISCHAEQTYWQQQVDYQIKAELNTKLYSLRANAKIRYQNNSPEALSFLYFELPQQRFRQLNITYDNRLAGSHSVEFYLQGLALETSTQHSFIKVQLPQPLAAGESIDLSADWQLQLIPRNHPLRPRSGFEMTKDNGTILAFAQWFPRAVGFDSQHGWDLLPFRGKGEFHLELGNYDVEISAPKEFLLVASAEANNHSEIFSQATVQALKQHLATKTEIQPTLNSQNKNNADKQPTTWRFRLKNARDFAFVAGDKLRWQRQTLSTANGPVQLNLLFPNTGRYLWQTFGLDAMAHTVSFLDSTLAPFPLPELTVVNITGIGMEYPGLKLVGFRGPDQADDSHTPKFSRTDLYDVIGGTIHEVAHAYFPMLVNSNERREGYLDEGITSYLSYLVEQAWSSDFQSFYGAPDEVAKALHGDYQAPVTQADLLKSKLTSHYHIPAAAWVMLEQQILKPGQLLSWLNEFIHINSHRRVYFSDLEAFLNAKTEINLTAYFEQWLRLGGKVDLAIADVTTAENVLTFKLLDKGGIKVPTDIHINLSSGKIIRHRVNYQDWPTDANYLPLAFEVKSNAEKITVDAANRSADSNRQNNLWLHSQQKRD